jgi:hypothetical protein
MSNALTVVSAILFRPYRFSSSNETELYLNEVLISIASLFKKIRVCTSEQSLNIGLAARHSRAKPG